jgi:threonine synthase
MCDQFQIQCRRCNDIFSFSKQTITCPACGHGWLDAVYPLEAGNHQNKYQPGATKDIGLWMFQNRLPVVDKKNIVSLGEGGTPLIRARKMGKLLGNEHIYLKDERQNPTGSFKDRQASVAISMMKEAGIKEAVVSSVGNVAIAYAAYAARAGIKLWVFVPEAIKSEKLREAAVYGAKIVNVAGTYDQTKKAAAEFAQKNDLFLDRGIKGIAAKEAMKTIAYELADQLGGKAPDWYLQSVSGGLGPVGVVKGFEELCAMGKANKVPKLGCIQVNGCAPMVQAFQKKRPFAYPITTPQTNILTLTTGDPGEAYEVLFEMMGQYGGEMTAVSDEEAYEALHCLARTEGISVEPATAVTFAGLAKLMKQGVIQPNETVVVNCSGHTMPVSEKILANHQPRSLETREQT